MDNIDWTDETWNPVRGCTPVGPGCERCYAAVFAERWRGIQGHPYEAGFDPRPVPSKLLEPLSWQRPRRILVTSMSDLLHEAIDPRFVEAAFDVMGLADWHVYQVLTRRVGRLEQLAARLKLSDRRHIWAGVSVENRACLARLEPLRRLPVAHRFLVLEPLLEDVGPLDLDGIDWVVLGGETGVGCRALDPEWVRGVRDCCAVAGVPFFFKQHAGIRRSTAGRELDGRTHDAVPQVAFGEPPSRARRQALKAEGEALLESLSIGARG